MRLRFNRTETAIALALLVATPVAALAQEATGTGAPPANATGRSNTTPGNPSGPSPQGTAPAVGAPGTNPAGTDVTAAPGGGELQEIVVTGSRIARPANLVAPNPVETLNAQDIQQTGLQSTGAILDQLPQTQNSQVPENNNRYVNGAGLEAINLRGLGTYRTLTLVDGRRHVGSLSGVNNSGFTSEVDTSVIAPLLIDHIDVVTGGSSAAYGADAVAGVVNFVLKKNYQGMELDVEEGGATEGGDSTTSVDAIWGANFADDRGNITVAFDYANRAAIKANQRDYTLNPTNYEPNVNGPPDFVTETGVRTRLLPDTLTPTVATALPGHPAYSQTFLPDGSGLTTWNQGPAFPGNPNVSVNNTGAGLITNQFLDLSSPNQRKIFDALINYKIADDVGPIDSINFFSDLKYADSRGNYYNGTNPILTSSFGRLPIPVSNPYIPADLRSELATYTGSSIVGFDSSGNLAPKVPGTIYSFFPGATQYTGSASQQGWAGPVFNIDRNSADWGPLRTSDYDYEYFRGVFGFEGKVFDRFNYELYYDYGRNETKFINQDTLTQNLVNALDTVSVNGAIVCRSSLTYPQNGCVPINPFKYGPLTAAQYNYVYTTTHENDRGTENDFVFNLNGDLFSYATPISGTVRPLGVAFGLEYREEDTLTRPDALQKEPSGTIGGNNAGTRDTIGGYKTREFYVETNVPLLYDLPGAKAVDFDGAIRFQSYSSTGDDWTWNARGTWAVTDDFKIRGGFAKAVRTPNEDELSSSGGQSFIALNDPCGGSGGINRQANPERRITCAAIPTYITTPFVPSSNISGNPGLANETAQTEQLGGIFTPSFFPRFALTADFYAIKIKDAIIVSDAQSILNQCYDFNDQASCQFISRNSDGSLNVVQTPYVNAGKESVQGVDFTANYLYPLADTGIDFSSVGGGIISDEAILGLNFDLNWTINHTLVPVASNPSTAEYLAGTFGFPHVKMNVKLSYDDGPFQLSATTRYYSEQAINIRNTSPTYDNNTIPALVYEDFYVQYKWRNITLYGGLQNAFDVQPPQLPTAYLGGNFPDANSNFYQTGQAFSVLDIVGRYAFGGVKIAF